MELRIVNPELGFSKAPLVEPTEYGYLYMAARVQRAVIPWVLPSAKRARLLRVLKPLVRDLERLDGVLRAKVFRAIVRPPTARFSSYLNARRRALHVADYDVLVLIEARSRELADRLRESPAYLAVRSVLEREAEGLFVMSARNAKRIGDVDTTRKGLFLFNHFAADDAGVMLELWEYLAAWYERETGLDNSVALVPRRGEKNDYVIVNWARWDEHPLRHFWHQLAKRGFWRYVTANLETNHAGSMPIYCRLA